jgi:hypothetical protein
VRVSESPTEEMPIPQSPMPIPRGSTIRPALSIAEAQSLSDQELIRRGYPFRPKPYEDQEVQDAWLQQVTREMTILPPSKMGASNILHRPVQAGGDIGNYKWSGFISFNNSGTYDWVWGQWNVPEMFQCESSTTTYSCLWVGIDGYSQNDLAQAGTEQDCTNWEGMNY